MFYVPLEFDMEKKIFSKNVKPVSYVKDRFGGSGPTHLGIGIIEHIGFPLMEGPVINIYCKKNIKDF